MKLSFLGAAREVTGSCLLVESADLRFLVDCGLFQGGREARTKNRQAFDFNPAGIDFVLLTHAHIDHSGLIPRLVAAGFRGPIYATRASCDLLEVLLPDAAFIQEKEAEFALRRRFCERKRCPEATPLYTVEQARDSLKRLRAVDYDAEIAPHARVRATFRDAGHILGSASLEVWIEDNGARRKLVFSGDLGQPGRPLVRDPTPIRAADVLVVESTYGNRLHKSLPDTEEELVTAVRETIVERGGNLIVPAFAVGRTQDMLYLFADLARRGRIPPLAVHVDSPMATKATEITARHFALLDEEARRVLGRDGGARHFQKLAFVKTMEESMALDRVKGGLVIVSASGMCEAGRVKFHLRANLPRREAGVVFTGFQAAGTLGRRLVEGAPHVRIFGEEVPVKARRYTLGGLSAHADRAALLGWLKHFESPPRQTFVVHGEAETAQGFAATIQAELGWPAEAPAPGQSVTLT